MTVTLAAVTAALVVVALLLALQLGQTLAASLGSVLP